MNFIPQSLKHTHNINMSLKEFEKFVKSKSELSWEKYHVGLSNFMLLLHYNEHYRKVYPKVTITEVLDIFGVDEFCSIYVNEKLLDLVIAEEKEYYDAMFADTPLIHR